ncbi:VIT domain-containing protein [Phormidium sp. CCY1219]|uniref:VIT domain-containing protein n=1 Tax=Phormidium sp. CCY1219 TaxID=2886104 RepID=UPI002D1EABC9|nr:VIT domain-containing protein [Phormidium sp. CCY1219]MEB3827916.1 after-VIT domain-containing protein [Phormidium sp. CCY1219]
MKFLYLFPATLVLAGTLGALATWSWAQSPDSTGITILSQGGNIPTAETPNSAGGLYVLSPDGEKQVFPLQHTKVNARIAGNLSRVEVTQTFENPFNDPLEAVYVFPLPDEAAVDDMEIVIGDRIIKGDIKQREEAQRIYEEARQQGRTAGLLEQERANIFTQSLANIKPGEEIKVTIRYTDSLNFEGGNYEFVFPMVVGPRYIPGSPRDNNGMVNTDRVPDASRITPPVLPPGTRSGHDIDVTVEINAGMPIFDLRSPSHTIRQSQTGETVRISLAPEDTIPNKDLILRYRVSDDRTQATVLTQGDDRGGHFAVYLIPALEYETNEIVPKDVVFLMDTSGSQSGDPLLKSKELMRRFINGLNPDDTFTIIDFSNRATALSPQPLSNTVQNRRRAMNYIDDLDANGGTELLNGIQTVLNFPPTEGGRLRSIVLLTDGYIGNENEVIAEVQRQLKPGNRLYSFGVGSSVNRFLLDRLAEVGRGTSQVIRQDEPTAEVAERFFRQINNPVLTNIEVEWEGSGAPAEVYPSVAPDLFAQQPLVVFGRKADRARGQLRVTGMTANGDRYEQLFRMAFDEGGNPAIAQLWARQRIKDLMGQMYGGETKSGVDAVTDTALAYRLLSPYTAFVAVSEEVRVDPDGTTRRVQVPVELPEGVSYEGVFGPQEEADMLMSSGANMYPGAPPNPQAGAPLPRRASGGTRGMPSMPNYESSEEPAPVASDRIEVLQVEGVDSAAIEDLRDRLDRISLPENTSGEVVWELIVRDGNVVRVLYDDIRSTLSESTVLDPMREILVAAQFPASVSGTIRITLRVKP